MNRSWSLVVIFVIVLAFAFLAGGLDGAFVLDDRPFLVENPQLDAGHSLAYFFSHNVWYYSNLPDIFSASYRPLFFLLYWQANQLGLADPLGLHVISLLLHVVASLLVLLLVRTVVPQVSPWVAGAAAGVFAIHPVHVEAVAWISAFVHPLAAVFILAAVLIHLRWERNQSPPVLGLALACYALGLLSNETASALPIFLLAANFIRFGNIRLLSVLPYFAVLFGYILVRDQVLGESVPFAASNYEAWLRLPAFLFEYLRHLLIPMPQPIFLSMPDHWSASATAYAASALFILLAIWTWRLPRPNRTVALLALAWVAVFLLPPLAASFSGEARFALRSLYLPSVGLSVLLASLMHNFFKASARPVLFVSLPILLLAAGATLASIGNWKNDGIVYERIVAWNPEHASGYLGLANFYEREGGIGKAIELSEKSVQLANEKNEIDMKKNLAKLLGQSGESNRSLELYLELTEKNPGDAALWNGAGNNYWAMGRPKDAAAAYRKAHEADPGNAISCYNLALVLNQLGKKQEAMRYLECAQGAH